MTPHSLWWRLSLILYRHRHAFGPWIEVYPSILFFPLGSTRLSLPVRVQCTFTSPRSAHISHSRCVYDLRFNIPSMCAWAVTIYVYDWGIHAAWVLILSIYLDDHSILDNHSPSIYRIEATLGTLPLGLHRCLRYKMWNNAVLVDRLITATCVMVLCLLGVTLQVVFPTPVPEISIRVSLQSLRISQHRR